MEIIGWIGGFLFALCGIPLAYQTFKDKHARGINTWFLHMWFTGEVLTLIYTIPKGLLPLIFNYAFNIACLLIVYYYKVRYKE